MKKQFSLPPEAVPKINGILSDGKDVQIAVRNGKLIVWGIKNKKEFEVVVARP